MEVGKNGARERMARTVELEKYKHHVSHICEVVRRDLHSHLKQMRHNISLNDLYVTRLGNGTITPSQMDVKFVSNTLPPKK